LPKNRKTRRRPIELVAFRRTGYATTIARGGMMTAAVVQRSASHSPFSSGRDDAPLKQEMRRSGDNADT
jgi:hypothetical protein